MYDNGPSNAPPFYASPHIILRQTVTRFFNYSTPPNQSKETKPRRLHFYLNLPYWDKTHKNLKISLQNEITKYNNEKNIQSHLNNKYIAPLLLESKKAAPFKGAAYE
ncbi:MULTISPECIES: hypothetical protein [unclassified Bartonella]|uniref:hypothetical protein n=1 Tax=unclassified Bartonella TaxID=2645622 RepID=UPI0035D10943